MLNLLILEWVKEVRKSITSMSEDKLDPAKIPQICFVLIAMNTEAEYEGE